MVDHVTRRSNDMISKSGDSGITELTVRDTFLANSESIFYLFYW